MSITRKLEFSIGEYRRFIYSFENPFVRDEDVKTISGFYNVNNWDTRIETEEELNIELLILLRK